MSIRSIVTTGVGINNGQRDIPTPTPPVVTNTSSAYVRPADWPALATLNTSSQQFSGLIAITNDNDNYVALTITGTGNYNVDWSWILVESLALYKWIYNMHLLCLLILYNLLVCIPLEVPCPSQQEPSLSFQVSLLNQEG